MTSPAKSTFVYVTYIRTTEEKLWSALTDPETQKAYWFGTHLKSDWKTGTPWKMVHGDGSITDAGEIVELVPMKRYVLTWRHEMRPELKADGVSRCTVEMEPVRGSIKLTVTHEIGVTGSKLIEAVGGGWPQVLSNLKSLLETGSIVLGISQCQHAA